MKSTAEYLERAADLMEKKGWVQGIDISPNGYCMRGAIYGACGATDATGMRIAFASHKALAARRVEQELNVLMGKCMVGWNDSECVSGQQAVRTLRQAAAALTPQFSDLMRVEAAKEVRKLVEARTNAEVKPLLGHPIVGRKIARGDLVRV